MLEFYLWMLAIALFGIALEEADCWYARRAERKAAKIKRAHWHSPSQYIMTHQDWRE